jgi:hypothetical protein
MFDGEGEYCFTGDLASSAGSRYLGSKTMKALPIQKQPGWWINTCIAILVVTTSFFPPGYPRISSVWANSILDETTPDLVFSPGGPYATSEAGQFANVDVNLTIQPTDVVTVIFNSADTTEVSVNPTSLVFTPEDYATPQSFSLNGVDDAAADGLVTTNVTVTVSSIDPAYDDLIVAPLEVNNADDEHPAINVTPSSALSLTEGGAGTNLSVSLANQPVGTVTVPINNSNPLAATASAGSLVFSSVNWNQVQTVTVSPVDDAWADGSQSFAITFGPVTDNLVYAAAALVEITGSTADNDVAGVVFSSSSTFNTTEAGGQASFTVHLSSQPTANVTLAFASTDIGEGTVSPSSLTFTTGNWASDQTVTITGVDDQIVDGNVSYQIQVTANSSDPVYNGLVIVSRNVINADNDTASVIFSKTTVATGEAGINDSFSVHLGTQPASSVVLALTVSDTSEAALSVNSLTFTTANWASNQSVTVSGVDDAVVDGTVNYNIDFDLSQSSDSVYKELAVSSISGTNTDNDAVGVVLSSTSTLLTAEDGTSDQFTVKLNSQPAAAVQILLQISDASEVQISPVQLNFNTSNWSTPQTVTVTGVDDAVVDGNVNFTVSFDLSGSTDPAYQSLSVTDIGGINQDNDSAGLVLSSNGPFEVAESGTTQVFTVKLSSQPTQNVILSIASSDTGEASVSPASLTFTSSNWNTAQSVTITGVDDSIVDGTVSFTLTLSPSGSLDPTYAGLANVQLNGNTSDNDVIGLTLSPGYQINTSEAGGSVTLSIQLSSQPTSGVTVNLAAYDQTEFSITGFPLTFSTANWSTPQSVSITGIDDAYVDGNISQNVAFDLSASADSSYRSAAIPALQLVNADNDTAGLGALIAELPLQEGGAASSFSVQLTASPLPAASVVLQVAVSDTTEGQVILPANGQITFTSANWNTPQTVQVIGVDDDIQDGEVSFSITVSLYSSTDPAFTSANTHGTISASTLDNDSAGLSVTPLTGNTYENGDHFIFSVALNTEPVENVIISAILSDSAVAEIVSPAGGQLTFTNTNWSQAQTVELSGIDLESKTENTLYLVTFSISGGDTVYTGLSSNSLPEIEMAQIAMPEAEPDQYQVNVDGLVVAAPGVLINDAGSAENGGLSSVISQEPDHGTLTLNADGGFSYYPNPGENFVGQDHFTYDVCQLEVSCRTDITVTLTVDALPPHAANWVLPVHNEEIFNTRSTSVILEAQPASADADVDYIWYARYDASRPADDRLIGLGRTYSSNYQFELVTADLPNGYIQIYAFVYDLAGNRSSAPNNRIIISHRYDYSMFLPVIRR